MTDFERALEFVLRWEGGYVNDPADPGGETNKGVTKAVYDAFRGKGNERSVREITDAEVREIYHSRYWRTGGCDDLTWPLSLAHFDAAVNTGVTQAGKLLARANNSFDRQLLERLKFYDALVQKRPALAKFLRGWVRRTLSLTEAA